MVVQGHVFLVRGPVTQHVRSEVGFDANFIALIAAQHPNVGFVLFDEESHMPLP